MPLETAAGTIHGARELMLAAACAAIEPRPYYHGRKFDDAEAYVDQLQMGQTEVGSFVIKIMSRVSPALPRQQTLPFVPTEVEDPFERLVTRTLMAALHATVRAVEQAAIEPTIETLEAAVNAGASANLFDAVLALTQASGNHPVDIGVSWATVRPGPTDAPFHVRVTPQIAPYLEEASRLFKARSPEGVELAGMIVRVHREADSGPGDVMLMGLVEGKPRKVSLRLTEEGRRSSFRPQGFARRGL